MDRFYSKVYLMKIKDDTKREYLRPVSLISYVQKNYFLKINLNEGSKWAPDQRLIRFKIERTVLQQCLLYEN